MYIFEKTVATFGTFTLLYTITEHYIIPLTPTSEQSFWRSMLDLALPFMVGDFLALTSLITKLFERVSYRILFYST
jgi:sterol O-acyltransferase